MSDRRTNLTYGLTIFVFLVLPVFLIWDAWFLYGLGKIMAFFAYQLGINLVFAVLVGSAIQKIEVSNENEARRIGKLSLRISKLENQ